MKYFYIFLTCSFLTQQSASQEYRPMPLANAHWVESCGGFEPSECSRSVFIIENTLLLNGFLHGRLVQHGVNYYTWGNGCSDNEMGDIENLVGCIRNDSINKKVYINPTCTDGGDEYLMYDFDLEIGDAVPQLYIMAPDEETHIITEIDEVILADGPHRRIISGSPDGLGVVFIEGVGCIKSLDSLFYNFESLCTVTCMVVNDQIIYNDESWNACNLDFLHVKDERATDISYYPVPANEHLTIDFGRHTTSASDLSVFNLFGQLVSKFQINPMSQFVFSTADFPEGIYHFKVDVPDSEPIVKSFAVFRN